MPGVPRVATRDTVVDDGEERGSGGAQKKTKKILEGQMVFVATSKAAMDPNAFPEPEKLDPYRPLSSYILLGHVSVFFFLLPSLFFSTPFSHVKGTLQGLHFCFGARLVAPALVATLKQVFKLKNLRRAAGRSGELHGVEHEISGTGVMMKSYLDHASKVCSFLSFFFLSFFFVFFFFAEKLLVGFGRWGEGMNYILIICEM